MIEYPFLLRGVSGVSSTILISKGCFSLPRYRSPQHFLRARRAVEIHRFGATLERERPQQTGETEHVVGVHVGEENVGKCERDPIAHHLPLRAFTTIEHQRLAFADNRE